ncbi:MobA/MobL family protein [Psychrobacter sp. FME13]|uniref:MobA/MobL family protein n=1 Tax=unclassified Psychrobacter TaxID=196806 RepID=UPI001787F2BA|nr:MobA/MobL family protein [Psychrobacter sp. FME13]MBE0443361.1 MobA/MobL family protein [Psychrobacter sp. FME13]
MAIGRLSVGIGKKGKASPHAKYIAREGKYAKPSYHEEKLENTGHGNMPKWAEHNPNDFWQMADEHERKNGSTYREHVIALPRELDEYERHELIKDWIAQEIGEKHAYQYAIHNPPALDGGEQPHAHIMFSERTIDDVERDPDQYFKRYNSKNPEKGGAKKANTPKFSAERKEELKAMRDRWEKTCNAHLERAGYSYRISMKSLKEQGIEREPINLTMKQLKEPEIREAYQAVLKAKEEDFKAELWVLMEFDGEFEEEIKHQLAQAEAQIIAEIEAKRDAHVLQEAFYQELADTDKHINPAQQNEVEENIEDSLDNRQKVALEAMRNAIDERFKDYPAKRQAKHDALNEKIPDMVAGKYELTPPTITVQPTVEVKTRDKVSQDKGIDL